MMRKWYACASNRSLLTLAPSKEKSGDEHSDAGSQAEAEDYDVDEEYDNDYAENYFDNGEGDDMDNLGDGGGDDMGGGRSLLVLG